MLPSVHHANTEQTASDSPDLTFYASLELSLSGDLLLQPRQLAAVRAVIRAQR
jgi:hypothetical protein